MDANFYQRLSAFIRGSMPESKQLFIIYDN